MNFSGISNHHFIGRMLRQPLKLLPAGTRVPILQGELRGKRWITGSATHGCWLGSYEDKKQKIFAASLKQGDVVYDVGANVGFYTLLASTLVGPNGRVYAFEPLPRNLEFLRTHLSLNRITNAEIFETAIADVNGEAIFDDSLNPAMGHLAGSGTRSVRTSTIDSLVFSGQLRPPSCMKIDVEGSEVQVLLGAVSVIQNHHPAIFLSTHGSDQHRECCHLLESLGYRLKAIGVDSVSESDELIAEHSDRSEASAN